MPISSYEDPCPHIGAAYASVFGDIDEQAAALQGWNQRYLQISAGQFRGSMRRLDFGSVGLFIEDLQQAVHQTGQVRADVIALGVPLILEGESLFCGQACDGQAIHVFSGNTGFEFRSPRRHVMLGLEIDRELFGAQVLDVLPVSAARFAQQAQLQMACPSMMQALRRFLLDVFAMTDDLAGAQRVQLQEEILARLASSLASTLPIAPSVHPGQSHAQLARRALDLVSTRLNEPPTVADLCSALNVSRRTLQNCFHATWGMGPLAWLNVLRLNAVRSRLKTAESVTEAATQLGFWHFGHFAHSYYGLFGELPSQTLRRNRSI
jgi:AraC family transcriptional regulator, ethanolamine operon transcriptional activator